MYKKASSIKRYITKVIKKYDDVPYAWINTEYKALSEEQIADLKLYFEKSEFLTNMIVVNNIEVARPQRTWGSMPSWFRPSGMYHSFDGGYHDNTFVFAIYNTECGREIKKEEIQEAIESFPETSKVIWWKKEGGD